MSGGWCSFDLLDGEGGRVMSESDVAPVETILKIGAEGGSITLQGQRDVAGEWQFRREE